MLTVKLSPYRPGLATIMARQTPGHALESKDGKYKFYLHDEIEDPDFWVVQGKGLRQRTTLNVAPENTLLLTTEPHSVLVYPRQYLQQFGLIYSSQKEIKHPRLRLGHSVLPWFLGYKPTGDGRYEETLDYDTLKKSGTPQKDKLIAIISSKKAFTQGHVERVRFVERLQQYFKDKIDVFGQGFSYFEDKWDVLAPYKYHIVVENSCDDYYWTEKITDCFLAETFPFYHGCMQLHKYFPEEAFVPIDIRYPEQTIARIEHEIAEQRYEQSRNALRLCKEKVLEEYNMFDFIAHLCDGLNPAAKKQKVTLEPCHSSQNPTNLFRYALGRNYYKYKLAVLDRFFPIR